MTLIALVLALLSVAANAETSETNPTDTKANPSDWFDQEFAPAHELMPPEVLAVYQHAAINRQCHLAASILLEWWNKRYRDPFLTMDVDFLARHRNGTTQWLYLLAENHPLLSTCYSEDEIQLNQTRLDFAEETNGERHAFVPVGSIYERPQTTSELRDQRLRLLLDATTTAASGRIAFARLALAFGDKVFFSDGALPNGFVYYQLMKGKTDGSPLPDDYEAMLGKARAGLTNEEVMQIELAASRSGRGLPPRQSSAHFDAFYRFEFIFQNN